MAQRRRWNEEFKQHAVDLANQPGVTTKQIAAELEISTNTLNRWCRERRQHGAQAFPGHGHARDEEMAALKRELARVKKERDFLHEAATFFAKASK